MDKKFPATFNAETNSGQTVVEDKAIFPENTTCAFSPYFNAYEYPLEVGAG